jgi:hypothetical protein
MAIFSGPPYMPWAPFWTPFRKLLTQPPTPKVGQIFRNILLHKFDLVFSACLASVTKVFFNVIVYYVHSNKLIPVMFSWQEQHEGLAPVSPVS